MGERIRAVGGRGQGIVLPNLIFKLELDLLPVSRGHLDCVQEIIVQTKSPSIVNVVVTPADILLHLLIPNPEQESRYRRRPLRDQFVKSGKVPGPALERTVTTIGRFTQEAKPRDEILSDFEITSYPVAHTTFLLDIKLRAPISRNAKPQSPMRVEPQTANKILGIICVADVNARTIEDAKRVIEIISPKTSSGLN